MIRRILIALMAVALAATVSACGKKGDLDPPPGKKNEYPRVYPR